ncbi:porin [Rhodobacteraceae bacterium R_SAG1]|jgi:outer membrane protein OmpU|uniref:Porin n=1 Tax=Phaeobacter italicus TaxID=481446 RepID=A0A0H5D663_9RHOB|nr:porin [Phaeobacter italicus]NKX70896.1 porin [Rhodobacteraceae bacterium R_SAG1]CRL12534.1 Porin [Phaeobacter italicus]
MKKILFATTALVATAGVAAAEVTIGGSARFGLGYTEGAAEETRVEQRMRVNITGIAETDAGVKFEARMRLEANEDANSAISGRGPGAAGFAVSYGGFRLDVGNVSDVIDSGDVVDYYGYGIGLTSFLEQSSNGALSLTGFGAGAQDQTTIKIRYSVGDFTVAASYSDRVAAGLVTERQQYQIGAGYNFGNYSIGAAFGSNDNAGVDDDFWAASFKGSVGAASFSVLASDSDSQADVTVGASLNYDVTSATAIRFVVSDGGAAGAETAYGLGFRHGLGGGVTLAGGVGQNSADNTVADLGVSFSF